MESGGKFSGMGSLIAAFCAGAAAGAAAGVLLAPAAGSESRRKAGLWLKEKREEGREHLLARRERLSAALEAGRDAFKGHKDRTADVGG